MLVKCMLKPDDIDKRYYKSNTYVLKDQTTAQDAFSGNMPNRSLIQNSLTLMLHIKPSRKNESNKPSIVGTITADCEVGYEF